MNAKHESTADRGSAAPQGKESSKSHLRKPLVSPDDQGIGADAAQPISTDRKGGIIQGDFRAVATLSGRFILIVVALAVAGIILKYTWTGLLPVLLAILVATALYPVSAWLRVRLHFPGALAALSTLVGFIAIVFGVFVAMAPTVSKQSVQLWDQAQAGINQLIEMVGELPIDIDETKMQDIVNDIFGFVKGQASNIATGVMSGFSVVSSIFVSLFIMVFLIFFMLKDGEKFLPWLRKYIGSAAGWHITELSTRIWKTLAGYIQTQAIVAFVDGSVIALGLWALQVPLAFVLGVITFFAGFIPLIGAIVAGALAVIIALVTHGVTTALLALLLIVAVQQLEGNILQPILQSKAMGLHAAVVLLSVTVGSALAGIIGAFLAVPIAATIAVVLRYQALITSIRSGEIGANEAEIFTGAQKPGKKSKQELDEGADTDHVAPDAALAAAQKAEQLDPQSPRAKVRELYHTLAPSS